jgi:hypothetical protein
VRTVGEALGVASAPTVQVTSPSGGTVPNGTPTIAGSSSATGATVTVTVWSGRYSTGSSLQQLTAVVGSDGSWSATPTNALAPGTYTVQASVKAGQTGTSTPTTFTVSGP